MNTFELKTDFRPGATLGLTTPLGITLRPPCSHVEAVRTVVLSVDENSLRRVAPLDAGLVFQPKTMLAVTLYCYAHDIYGSEEIEDALRRDAAFRMLCSQEFPDARVLRRFRRENRETLHHSLVALLWILEAGKTDLELRTATTETQITEEATRRIGKAMFIDSMGIED